MGSQFVESDLDVKTKWPLLAAQAGVLSGNNDLNFADVNER